MSYKIKFDDITSVQVESQKTMNAWEEAIASLNKAMSDFINNQNLQGQAISSMRTYLVEVHGTLLQTLVNLMNDYSTNLLLYKDGYYQIDGDLHTKLPSKVFTNLHSALKSSRDDLKGEIELLNTTKDKISDLVSYEGSSHTSTVMNYNFLMNQLKNLDTSITQYESNHASQDLVAFKELLSATKALVAEHAGKTRTVGTYQSGDFAKLQSVQRFAIAYKQATQQMESRVERVQAAQERDKVRFEALATEDRAKNGWKDLAIGVVTVAIGALAIWATMGAATPLVVGAGLTAGIGTAAYGASNAGEGIHNIQLGNAGDAHTKSYNLIRDTLFMGNDKLYHDVGNVFVTASAIMIPIGQTQSVVKGLTQFAIGEAGAYTAGQVAYHGTKLLGGSEEDAQTANFIGNIVGGYAVSSAASKFSLNNVKNNVSEQNFANYREFSTTKIDDFKTNFKDVETRITVETRNVADEIQRIQLKAVGVDETGKIRIQDYTTAKDGLSIKRQDILDNLSKYGGTIVGEGKGRFTGGTKIEPGTRIDVISKPTDSFTIEKVSSFDKVKQYTSELYKTDLSLEEKVQKLQKYFTELDDKVDINVPSDAQYVKSIEDGWISYDWPERLGFKKGTVHPITRTSGLPERWDRFGHMGGGNFSDIPSEGPYTYSQRSIPYVENLKAYHNGNFKTDSYFDKIDAISEGDIKIFNRILREEGIEGVSQDQFLELSDKYRKYISDTSTSLSMSSDDIKYGVHGKAAEWGDMSGGAEQIVTPFGGIDMLNMGMMEEFK
ncbi:LXG domain-containing protein [Streptococcus mitis]|uniref:LXG domain-containing protein n=1 Tax=Streptococcus mitis TaxID=28037 RepID=UPI0021B70AD1|nr:LXG domain-containing protein [Streptococcus mitis]